jgi:hypothetical protein
LPLLGLAAFPLAVFLWFFHWRILIPTNWAWLLEGDWGAHLIGWTAFRHDAWRWPLGATRLLAWPKGTTVTYTDSNALISLFLKPFSAVLPEPFQFTGLWLLSRILLQFFAAYALLRHASADPRLRALGAALFTLVPTLLNRTPHSNLCAHWTILLSLHAYLNVRDEGRRDLWFAGLLALSGLIHPYFVLMNGCVWTGDLLRRAFIGLRAGKPARLGQLAARAGAVAGFAAAVLWAAGALNGDYRNGGDGFGLYAMPLDVLFNPFRSDFSRFVPAKAAAPSQLYEGFQYLGAGLLFLVLTAGLALAAPVVRRRLKTMGWVLWLAPGLLLLAALALSDQVQLHGRVLLHLRYDWLPFDLTGAFRASGRLFWPCTYVLLLAAMELAFSLPVALAQAVAVAALLLQVLDLPGFAKVNRRWTAEADRPHVWMRASSSAWDRLVTASELVQFVPPDPHVDDKLFYEIAWRAAAAGRPVNIMYTSRTRPAQRAIELADRVRFLSGEVDPAGSMC